MSIPAIPDIDANNPESIQAGFNAIKEVLEILLARRGSDTDDNLIRYGLVRIEDDYEDAADASAITLGAGADSVDRATFNTDLATLISEINALIAVVNDIRYKLKP